MEVLIYLILGSIFGVSVGNTNIRNKIAAELRQIMTKGNSEVVQDCPIKVHATYRPKAGAKTETRERTTEQPKATGGCNKCGGAVEVIDKMPGYFFCTSCNSITSKKKDNANKS
jgi:hypothetical protein